MSIGVLLGQEFSTSPEGRNAVASGPMDWILLALSVVIVLVVIVLCAKYFLRPGETAEDHIKRRVLRDEPADQAERSRRENHDD